MTNRLHELGVAQQLVALVVQAKDSETILKTDSLAVVVAVAEVAERRLQCWQTAQKGKLLVL